MARQNTLTDSFGRIHDYLRLSLTSSCNLRCGYCRPGAISGAGSGGQLSDDETLRLVRLFAGMGVRKVRLTGGEPLLRTGIERLVERVVRTPGIDTVGLTTNGMLLERKVDSLASAGLDRLNVSLDSLRPERFRQITGSDGFDQVWGGIEAAAVRGFRPLKINVVVVRGVNDDELADFVELTRDREMSVRFIEYMPVGANDWHPERLVGWFEMLEWLSDSYALSCLGRDGVARRYRVNGFAGEIGFISPLTGCFCGNCSRLRLSAAGALRTCLHGGRELDLGSIVRAGATDVELEDAVRGELSHKQTDHRSTRGDGRPEASHPGMAAIGG